MYTNNKLAKSVRLALLFGGASIAMTGTAVAQDQSAEAQAEQAQERIQVTGSRLNRTDMEGALPVTVISREDLDASGDISVADFMRDTNFNSFGSYQSRSEEHTSELQSRENLVCRLLLEKKKQKKLDL